MTCTSVHNENISASSPHLLHISSIHLSLSLSISSFYSTISELESISTYAWVSTITICSSVYDAAAWIQPRWPSGAATGIWTGLGIGIAVNRRWVASNGDDELWLGILGHRFEPQLPKHLPHISKHYLCFCSSQKFIRRQTKIPSLPGEDGSVGVGCDFGGEVKEAGEQANVVGNKGEDAWLVGMGPPVYYKKIWKKIIFTFMFFLIFYVEFVISTSAYR